MKVVLINPPQKTGYPQPPMGLALLAAVLEREKHTVTIIDYNTQLVIDAYLSVLLATTDVVGITAVTPTIIRAWEIARKVKALNPKVKVVMGGQHVSLLAQ